MVPLGSVVKREGNLSALKFPPVITAFAQRTSMAIPRPAIPPVRRRMQLSKYWMKPCPRGISYEWTELTYQQILAGNTAVFIFPLMSVFCVFGAGRAI